MIILYGSPTAHNGLPYHLRKLHQQTLIRFSHAIWMKVDLQTKKKIDEEFMPSLSGQTHPLGNIEFSEYNLLTIEVGFSFPMLL